MDMGPKFGLIFSVPLLIISVIALCILTGDWLTVILTVLLLGSITIGWAFIANKIADGFHDDDDDDEF